MQSTQSDIPSSELVRNLIFLGTTGSGKSTTCNTLYGNPNGPFPVGHDEISCTSSLVDHVRESKRIRLIDTPGFNDNRFNDKTIEDILGGLTSVFLDRRVDSTKHVDAFVLVVKMNPRAQTLKEDLLRVRNLFGTQALKSLVLLVIQRGGDSRSDSKEFLEKLKEMKEVVKILKAGKQEEANEDWFCLWDNVEPRPGQEEQLMGKIRKLEPYTSRRFLEAELEDKEVIDTVLKEEIAREVEKYKQDISGRIESKEMEKIREKVEKERRMAVEARDNAVMNMTKVVEAVQKMNERTVGDLEKLYKHMVQIREEREGKYMDAMGSQRNDYGNQLEEFLKQNREILKGFENRIEGKVKEKEEKIEKVGKTEGKKDEEKEYKSWGENIAKILGLAGRGDIEEKKEALKDTANKGAKVMKEKSKEGVEEAAKTVPKDAAKDAVKDVAKKGVKEVAKKGAIIAATKACNMF